MPLCGHGTGVVVVELDDDVGVVVEELLEVVVELELDVDGT